MAEVIPFPLTAQVALIHRVAGLAAGMGPSDASRYLARQLKLQRQALIQRRVPEKIAQRESERFIDSVQLAAGIVGACRGGDAA